jgi:hypothetical protein
MTPETRFERFYRSLLAIALVLVASPILLVWAACSGLTKAWR